MDVSTFFNYPTEAPHEAPEELALLPDATRGDWDKLLASTDTRRFSPGDVVVAAGERDRALYLLTDGRLSVEDTETSRESWPRTIDAPAVVGELGFLDGEPRSVTLRALTEGEMLRLSFDAFEALAARDPRFGRELLLDLARIVATRLRRAGRSAQGAAG